MIPRRALGRNLINAIISKIVASWIRCRSWKKMFVFVIQWQRKIFKKSFAFKKNLSISLSFRPCSSTNKSLMNYFLCQPRRSNDVFCYLRRKFVSKSMNWFVGFFIWYIIDSIDVSRFQSNWFFWQSNYYTINKKNSWFDPL